MDNKKIIHEYENLLKECSDKPNAVYFSKIFASWLVGESALPQGLGLNQSDFKDLLTNYFHKKEWYEDAPSGISIPEIAHPEKEELIEFFLEHRAGKDQSEILIAKIMAAGCMAKDHLWHDLGLWCRPDLSSMIQENFPSLFDKNIKNMKWKKFFYKQMCLDLDLSYTCKIPSCSDCSDFTECYNPNSFEDEFDKSTIKPI